MKGTVSHEVSVPAAAGEVWAVYGSLQLSQLTVELIPAVIEKAEVVEGDGGEGTVVKVTLPAAGGTTEPLIYTEKFIKVDNVKLIKEAEAVEGGYLDLGFRLYRVRFEIIEESVDSSLIRSSIDYEIEQGFEQNVGLVTTDALAVLAEAIGNYLTQQKPV